MYDINMAVAVKMKPVTVYLQDLKYLEFQKIAAEQNRKAAELVRDAMDEYLVNHSGSKNSLDEWKPLTLGGLKSGAADWLSKDYQDEILSEGFKI